MTLPFKKEKHDLILAQQTELLSTHLEMRPVVAYQKALKILWDSEDQEHWELLAHNELDDEIFEYVIIVLKLFG